MASLLLVPRPLWPRLDKSSLARLLEIKVRHCFFPSAWEFADLPRLFFSLSQDAKCLPWMCEILEANEEGEEREGKGAFEMFLGIPNRLIFAFTSKEDLQWALKLSNYSEVKQREMMQSSRDPTDAVQRDFINSSHKRTMDVLQNAALQKMMYKKGQLEEELKSLEAKINDEWVGKN